jgi:NitT/TauT family transport system permease protein
MNPSSKYMDYVAPLLLFLILVIVWYALVDILSVPSFILPSPTEIAVDLVRYYRPILVAGWITLWRTMVGFGLALVVGCVLGAIIGISRLAHKSAFPLLVGFNAIPKSAFVPVLVVWFGMGSIPAVLMAFLLAFFPITVNVATGLATLEPELEDVLRSLGARRLDILLKVGFPRSMPYLFAACKISIALAFVGTVVSETVASGTGIGYLMMEASSSLRMSFLFAALVVISIMSMVMYQVFAIIETRMTGWAQHHE